jgi:hypothetical protein
MVINNFIQTEIVEKIDLTLNVTYEIIGATLYLNSCNWKWMQLTNKITIDGTVYEVVESDNIDYTYMVNDFEEDNVTKVSVLNFHFYEGTAIDVTTVFQTISNIATEKLPMVWLSFNPLPLIYTSSDRMLQYPTSIDCTVYLAGLTDYGIRHTKEHMSEVVNYLSYYVEEIDKVLDLNPVISQEYSVRQRQLPIFGSLGKGGFIENVLDETNLSAIELKLNFDTEKKCYC